MNRMHWLAAVALSAAFAYGWSPRLSPLMSFPAATVAHILLFVVVARCLNWKPTWSIVLQAARETVLAIVQLSFLFKDFNPVLYPFEITFSTNNNYYLDNHFYSVLNATIALFASFVFLIALSIHTLIYRRKRKMPLISFRIAQIIALILALAIPLYFNATPETVTLHWALYGWPFLAIRGGVETQVIWIYLLLNTFLLLAPAGIYLILRGAPVSGETRLVSIVRIVIMVGIVVFFAYVSLAWKLAPYLWGWPYYFRIYDYDLLRILLVDLYYLVIYCFAIFNIRPNPSEGKRLC